MKRPIRALLTLAFWCFVAACDRPPTSTPTPTVSFAPTASPAPTATLAPASCAAPYQHYRSSSVGFNACYPVEWMALEQPVDEPGVRRVSFQPPPGAEGAGLRFVAVAVSPATAGLAEEEFLQQVDNWLRQEFYRALLSRPHFEQVGARRAVSAGYEATVVLGRQAVPITRWITVLRSDSEQWFIEVAGRSEFRQELESIRAAFLQSFRLQ
jgi:hypothetical protein